MTRLPDPFSDISREVKLIMSEVVRDQHGDEAHDRWLLEVRNRYLARNLERQEDHHD